MKRKTIEYGKARRKILFLGRLLDKKSPLKTVERNLGKILQYFAEIQKRGNKGQKEYEVLVDSLERLVNLWKDGKPVGKVSAEDITDTLLSYYFKELDDSCFKKQEYLNMDTLEFVKI